MKTGKRRKGKVILAAAGVVAAAVVMAVVFYRAIYRVEPVFSTATYELGERVSNDTMDYISGTEWSRGLAQLDLSGVDRRHAGVYEAVLYHGREAFVYTIIIEDTTPPEIRQKEGQVFLAAGAEIRPEDAVAEIVDKDRDTEAYFIQDGQEKDAITFEEPGEYTLEVGARDSSNNQSRVMLAVTVDIPPEIVGVRDFYVTPGSEPDFLESVTAADKTDSDLTASIIIDDSEIHLGREGVYELSYSVEDDCGLVTEKQATVTVASPGELQKMIGSRRINRWEDVILGAPNPYDAGAMQEDDLEAALAYMRPALVQLYHERDNGYSSGSGYIMEITEDTVYICSNRHVAEKYDDWDVFFYDGTRVDGEHLGSSEGYDVGVVTVRREDIPEGLQEQLMTVHIDKSYWSGLDEQALELGLERVDRKGGILHVATGSLIKVKQFFEWYDGKDHTEVTVQLEHGDSGSAILDGRGNLISMAYAYSTDPTRYWCVPLDGILESYEEITGRQVYVY
ncbi:MAG: DUF5011 domain-containing protein [Muribaculaceae bacterium]|nr:DUF5011 domain-containing protein [Muribaculaceae bacterium]